MLCVALAVPEARALDLRSTPLTPRQVGTTNRVQVGLAVQGWTDTLQLTVAGAYQVNCPAGLPIEAQRAASATQYPAGFSFTLTVPGWIPAEYVIPGWSEWAAPATKTCNFVYTGRAKEALVSLSGFGIQITLGSGERVDGNTRQFTVVKPESAQPRQGKCLIP
jgi:hypothetical protein